MNFYNRFDPFRRKKLKCDCTSSLKQIQNFKKIQINEKCNTKIKQKPKNLEVTITLDKKWLKLKKCSSPMS